MRTTITRGGIESILRLALPLAMAELGWVSMSIVDTIMVGHLGAEAIGAVSVGSSLYLAVAISGIGLLLGLDTVVSHAFGAGRLEECHRWLVHGVYLSLLLTAPLSVVMLVPIGLLEYWGTDPAVLELTIPYLETLTWSLGPLLLYATFRRYLQALSRVKSVMLALVSANIVNAVANWILIFGNLGAPRLGVEGAGWATFVSRLYLALFLLLAILNAERSLKSHQMEYSLKLEWFRILGLVRLGFPAAVQLALEVGVFALATALASRLDAISLAAHQLALSTASFTFMVPLGISSAGAVLVGQAIGARNLLNARVAGWNALFLGGSFMAVAALCFLCLPGTILSLYTAEQQIISVGITLLAVAAFFQVFDGLQVISTGVLRGSGDTRTPMISNLLGHWLIGLPIGYLLCFKLNWGVLGLWIGLSLGLTLVGIWLVSFWSMRIRWMRDGRVPIPTYQD
jgi:MATE family multidrug resistance protein